MENNKILYVVISREMGLIMCTFDEQKAIDKKNSQTLWEEMGGGRPSVRIEKTKIV